MTVSTGIICSKHVYKPMHTDNTYSEFKSDCPNLSNEHL